MSNSYGAIPTTEPKASADEASTSKGSKHHKILAIAIGLAIFFVPILTKPPKPTAPTPPEFVPSSGHWPGMLLKIDAAINFPNFLPTTTTGLKEAGWRKTGEPCDPLLGEPWAYEGERSLKFSAAIYMTPQVGDVPGVVSGVETSVYGYVPEKLIGSFYGEEKTSTDGSYRSVSVALRNGGVENLCDTQTPVSPGNPEYVMIAPGMANMPVAVTEDPELLSDWKAGSCLPNMGYHWINFLEGADELPYQAENMVPVIPMYSSFDQTISGVFISAADKMQVDWPGGKAGSTDMVGKGLNFWDNSPGLLQETDLSKRFFMCGNFCGPCELEGAANGFYTTMHWMFKNTVHGGEHYESCQAGGKPNCREGDWAGIPKLKLISVMLVGKFAKPFLMAVLGGYVSFFLLNTFS